MKFLFAVLIISAIFISESLAAVYWTKWLDRDNPSGTGDYEGYANFVHDGKTPCRCGYKPVQAYCKRKNGKQWYTANKKIVKYFECTPRGIACRNVDQGCKPSTICCPDFKIRFKCYKH